MNKTASIIITVGLIIGIGIILWGGRKVNNNATTKTISNVVIKDGIQYITINAKGGYIPAVTNAKSGITTKLIVKTNGTYDCSASLVVRPLNFQKILPQTGETVIDAGIPVAGTSIQGICGMGMYNFVVDYH
ncbi:MAG: hypothetical protein KGI58_00460 [Patescibacteria group bacterium]|nr:hypothetical protein [Patescibacteria group bacterium]